MGPGDLEKILMRLPEDAVPELLSSLRDGEDAGVYLLADDTALVQTVDLFPPIVDDPYSYGQIAAANALSDLYAMGARPLTALNIAAFPCGFDLEVITQVLLGGHDKVREAGAVLLGGHTIEDDEVKYGLAVTGVAHPERLTMTAGARPGDVLLLTKPVGTGILATALKGGFMSEQDIAEAMRSMCTLNARAAEVFGRHGVHACTDVTGFGLVGHLLEMVQAGRVAAELWAARVPLFEHTLEMVGLGMVAGALRSEPQLQAAVKLGPVDGQVLDCLFDPQTSGGLLGALPPEQADAALEELRSGPCPRASAIGRVKERDEALIEILTDEGA